MIRMIATIAASFALGGCLGSGGSAAGHVGAAHAGHVGAAHAGRLRGPAAGGADRLQRLRGHAGDREG